MKRKELALSCQLCTAPESHWVQGELDAMGGLVKPCDISSCDGNLAGVCVALKSRCFPTALDSRTVAPDRLIFRMRRGSCLAAYACTQPSFIGTVNGGRWRHGLHTGPSSKLSVLTSALSKLTDKHGLTSVDVPGMDHGHRTVLHESFNPSLGPTVCPRSYSSRILRANITLGPQPRLARVQIVARSLEKPAESVALGQTSRQCAFASPLWKLSLLLLLLLLLL